MPRAGQYVQRTPRTKAARMTQTWVGSERMRATTSFTMALAFAGFPAGERLKEHRARRGPRALRPRGLQFSFFVSHWPPCRCDKKRKAADSVRLRIVSLEL